MNKLFDPNLEFDEKEHKYTLLTKPEMKFTSTTSFIHTFFKPFEAEKTAEKLVTKVPKYKNKTKDEVLADWNKSAADGTAVHKELEKYILNRRTRPKYLKAREGVKWLKDRVYSNSSFTVYTEATLYSEEIKITGTIDLLIYNDTTDEYVLGDWKTNKMIRQTGFKGAMGTKWPCTKLEDCNYNHYVLQLSMYRYLLEKYYGLTVKNQFLIHLREAKSVEYPMPYLKDTIEEMLIPF